MLAWLFASRLMLHFALIHALGIHGHRLVIAIKDDRSVVRQDQSWLTMPHL